MATREPDVPDAPACPFLGLESDRRSRFTYPHPGHRCYATHHPLVVDARHQAAYCTSLDFPSCVRFVARHVTGARREDANRQPGGRASTADPDPAAYRGPVPRVVVVCRAGDSLARIAAAYGVDIGRLAAANGLTPEEAIPDGTRLILPLRSRVSTGDTSESEPTVGGG